MTTIKVYFDGLMQYPQHTQSNAAFRRLVAVGQIKAVNKDSVKNSLHALLCHDYGLNLSGDCPIAALTQLGEFNEATDATSYWLLASPVHLTLQRDFFSMTEVLTLSEAESLAFIANLNAHFADDGYVFSLTPSLQWLLTVPKKHELLTTPLAQVVGQDTRAYLPKGTDAAWAAQLTNEIEMLLFEHPSNQAREARGELAINSIWLSGTGVLPAAPNNKASRSIYADNGFAKGIARRTQLPLMAMPQSITQLLSHHKIQGDRSETIIWIDGKETQHDWFTEILQLLRRRKLCKTQLYFDWQGSVVELSLTQWDVWRFWRKSAK